MRWKGSDYEEQAEGRSMARADRPGLASHHVPEVAVARQAAHLGAHPVRVWHCQDGALSTRPESRPAAAAIEFRAAVVERGVAADAAVRPVLEPVVKAPQSPGDSPRLRAAQTSHAVHGVVHRALPARSRLRSHRVPGGAGEQNARRRALGRRHRLLAGVVELELCGRRGLAAGLDEPGHEQDGRGCEQADAGGR